MIEKHQVIERIRRRNRHNPRHQRRYKQIHRMLFLANLDMILLIGVLIQLFIPIHNIHQERSRQLHNQKLQHILLAPISEVFSLFPMSQLVGFLAVVEGEEMVNLFLVVNHDDVDFLVLDTVLRVRGRGTCQRSYARQEKMRQKKVKRRMAQQKSRVRVKQAQYYLGYDGQVLDR